MAAPYRTFRLEGPLSFPQAVREVDSCISQALEAGDRRMLVDVRGLTGFDKPDLLARLEMVRRWAATSQGRVKVAMISRQEINDAERFDVVLAQGLGFDGNVFETEEDAIHWLEQEPALWAGPPPNF
ncbi:hypothetical protein [Arenimonas sp. MALMAid1274]|uniref:hypothetical protein n=1 Tax=Arenimonas sp. MALMAid1274 TaxID=3411630 RepID=UPI003BA24065